MVADKNEAKLTNNIIANIKNKNSNTIMMARNCNKKKSL